MDSTAAPKTHSSMRTAFTLDELLELFSRSELIDDRKAADVVARATTLRSQVLKQKVGAVRSQAAARYDVTPAEIVSAAKLSHPDPRQGKIDEEHVAVLLAQSSGFEYRKIDPLKVDGDLITKTLPRPFARHHVVVPLSIQDDVITVAITDPFDSVLRHEIETTLREELSYVVASKVAILVDGEELVMR